MLCGCVACNCACVLAGGICCHRLIIIHWQLRGPKYPWLCPTVTGGLRVSRRPYLRMSHRDGMNYRLGLARGWACCCLWEDAGEPGGSSPPGWPASPCAAVCYPIGQREGWEPFTDALQPESPGILSSHRWSAAEGGARTELPPTLLPSLGIEFASFF